MMKCGCTLVKRISYALVGRCDCKLLACSVCCRLLSRDVAVLDLTKSLAETAGASGSLLYHPKEGHYNRKGYRVAATEIAEFLEDLGGVGKREAP